MASKALSHPAPYPGMVDICFPAWFAPPPPFALAFDGPAPGGGSRRLQFKDENKT